MRKHLLVKVTIVSVLMFMFVSCSSESADGDTKANVIIDECLKKHNCDFLVWGFATPDPAMTFVVLQDDWIKFSEQDKNDLRNILKQKIIEAKKNPNKYNTLNPSAPIYNKVNQNIVNMSSYSVILSGGKNNGALLMDNEILRNF
jgi:hypothetical protein